MRIVSFGMNKQSNSGSRHTVLSGKVYENALNKEFFGMMRAVDDFKMYNIPLRSLYVTFRGVGKRSSMVT